MGVRGLQSFVKYKVENGYLKISIKEICEEYQRQHKGQKPTIVVDASGLSFLTNYRNLIYGGREHEDFLMFDRFYKQLSEYADLVFYRDGVTVKDKQRTYEKRKEEEYERRLKIFDWIKQGLPVSKIEELSTISEQNNLVFNTVGKVLQKNYGKVLHSHFAECDAEIVKYINEHEHAIAVLSDDSDFLIFAGDFRFFSLEGLKIRQDMSDEELVNLETYEFNRQALRKFIGLNDLQMIVLSTLCGNDVVKYESSVDFRNHRDIGKHIRSIYVMNMEEDQVISKMAKLTDIPIELIQASFDFYSTNMKSPKFNDPVINYCIENDLSFLFKIYQRFPVLCITRGYDYRLKDETDMFKVNVFSRAQLAGIVFFHNRHDDYSIVADGRKRHDSLHGLYKYGAIYPENVNVPPIWELINREKFPQHDKIRFWLLKWIIIRNEPIELNIENIPKDFLKEMLVLFHMRVRKIATSNETDILLLSLKRSKQLIAKGIKIGYKKYPTRIKSKSFSLALIFNELMVTIDYIFEVLGLKQMLNNSFYFDGVLFHKFYAVYADGLADGTKIARRELQDFRDLHVLP